MPGISVISNLLQGLPAPLRRTLYAVVSLAGAVIAVCQIVGWKTLGPVSLDQALQAYALISPAVGVVAVANVSTATGTEDFGQGFDDDFDLSTFHANAPEDFSADV